jgi:hypothetical protein
VFEADFILSRVHFLFLFYIYIVLAGQTFNSYFERVKWKGVVDCEAQLRSSIHVLAFPL